MSTNTGVEEEKNRLIEAIRDSETYRRFENAKELLKGEEVKKSIIDNFREKAYLLSNSSEPLDHMDDLEDLFVVRREIRKDPMIDEYLTAEHEYCRMIQRICSELMALSDVQIEAFEDSILVR